MRIVGIIALVLVAPALRAQPSGTISVFFGRTNGALLRDTPSSGFVKGFTTGIAWAVPFRQTAALEIGGAVVQRGGSLRGRDVLLEYIEAPLSLRVSDQSATDGLHPFARVGMAMSLKRNCRILEAPLLGNEPDVRRVAASTVASPGNACSALRNRGYDIGPLAGVGLEWRSGISRFLLELRRTDGRRLIAFDGDEQLRPSTMSLLVGMGWAP